MLYVCVRMQWCWHGSDWPEMLNKHLCYEKGLPPLSLTTCETTQRHDNCQNKPQHPPKGEWVCVCALPCHATCPCSGVFNNLLQNPRKNVFSDTTEMNFNCQQLHHNHQKILSDPLNFSQEGLSLKSNILMRKKRYLSRKGFSQLLY